MIKSLTKTTLTALATAATLAVSIGEAQAYRTVYNQTVNPVAGGKFEAIEDSFFGNRGVWCAASEYALRELGVSSTTRIYVQSPIGRSVTGSNRRGVVFGLKPPAGVSPVQVVSTGAALKTPGANLSVSHAQQFCLDYREVFGPDS
ncbi:MAG: hypothetical protein HRU30_01845 [Rhodobacteraceae bacterium]|nr:hypothetical protein [Paracoccaceae bacterium]